ncbi:MAG: hypothetical protein ACRD4F_08660, partial [Candidatus Angelobacter sp.]
MAKAIDSSGTENAVSDSLYVHGLSTSSCANSGSPQSALGYGSNLGFFHIVFHRTVENPEQTLEPQLPASTSFLLLFLHEGRSR